MRLSGHQTKSNGTWMHSWCMKSDTRPVQGLWSSTCLCSWTSGPQMEAPGAAVSTTVTCRGTSTTTGLRFGTTMRPLEDSLGTSTISSLVLTEASPIPRTGTFLTDGDNQPRPSTQRKSTSTTTNYVSSWARIDCLPSPNPPNLNSFNYGAWYPS